MIPYDHQSWLKETSRPMLPRHLNSVGLLNGYLFDFVLTNSFHFLLLVRLTKDKEVLGLCPVV